MGELGKAGFRGGPRPVRWVTAPGGTGDCARSQGRLRPVAGVTAPGGMGGPGWRCFSGAAWGKGLILLESGFWGKFLGEKNIVRLYFLGLAGWIILIAPHVARTVWFVLGASGGIATEVARTNLFDVAHTNVFSLGSADGAW